MRKNNPCGNGEFPKKCILDEEKICDNCCSCFVCDLDPNKICDNCAKCLELADFKAIEISGILYDDKIFDYAKNGKGAKGRSAGRKREKAVAGTSGQETIKK